MITHTIQLVAPIGEGGMGTVWEAYHYGLATEVAVKFASSRDPEILQRFQREAELTARIASTHVVQIFERGEADGAIPYLVMERLRGQTLAERLRAGPLDAHSTSWLLWQMADAIGRAHAAGVIHRDLKPDNVFLVEPCPDGCPLHAKLLDFGLGRASDPLDADEDDAPLTRMGSMMGTPTYSSPEQLKDASSVDHRVDVWGIGVTIYEALSGAPPFQSRELPLLLLMICRGEFQPIAARLGLPPGVDDWLRRAICVDRDRRFPTTAAMIEGWRSAFYSSIQQSDAPPESSRHPGSSYPGDTSGIVPVDDDEESPTKLFDPTRNRIA